MGLPYVPSSRSYDGDSLADILSGLADMQTRWQQLDETIQIAISHALMAACRAYEMARSGRGLLFPLALEDDPERLHLSQQLDICLTALARLRMPLSALSSEVRGAVMGLVHSRLEDAAESKSIAIAVTDKRLFFDLHLLPV